MQLDKDDFEEIRQNYNQALLELEDFENKTSATKKDIIIRLKLSARLMVENEQIPIALNQLSSYVWSELDKRGITYPRNHFIEIFANDEKRNYSELDVRTNHKHEFLDGECACGDIEKEGIVYTPKLEEPEPKEKEPKKLSYIENYLPKEYQKLFQQYVINFKEIASISHDLLLKGEDYHTAEIIIQALPDVNKRLYDATGEQAHLIALSKKFDARQKITEFMKLKAILLEHCEYTIAKVAKLLSVTPKHMTNNIIKPSNPQTMKKNRHHDDLLWFKVVDVKCPKCGEKHIVNFDDWFTEQIARTNLSLSFKDPIINYGVAQ